VPRTTAINLVLQNITQNEWTGEWLIQLLKDFAILVNGFYQLLTGKGVAAKHI
jgi:hypothetical protein